MVASGTMSTGDPRPDLLFLCHRIPYPPDKGDKIRSYHWLRALADRFRVHLLAFVDDPADWQHRDTLEQLCATCRLLPLNPKAAKLRSLQGLLAGEPLTLPYYRDRRLRRALKRLRESTPITHVFVYSSAMAQYALDPAFDGARRVIDFVDVDSDKWRQYAERMQGIWRWVYSREARKLAIHDFAAARAFDAALFVSAAEAEAFRDQSGISGDGITHVSNGVDTVYFDPALEVQSPYERGVRAVVFTGAMDYWANIDAVTWFVREAWPRIRAEAPQAVLYIVGSRPTPEVTALASPDVRVTGRVADVRPYLQHAVAVVAPMRVARGIQNKVLEGMAMAKPVVVTPKGLEGIEADTGAEVLVADNARDFADAVLRAPTCRELGSAARLRVQRGYSWPANCDRLVDLVKAGGTVAAHAATPPDVGGPHEPRRPASPASQRAFGRSG